ncbi:conserved Plasmodium protein, unknown function [Plasmodium malariae]|uniref:Fam-b protein n=1 Tax=Plasmodium malariae TaxID=5858 RepID=A0A1C3KYS1_PLAMA|nr:conserved Plasmodium protein, unknown function [Plasmodium malariae]
MYIVILSILLLCITFFNGRTFNNAYSTSKVKENGNTLYTGFRTKEDKENYVNNLNNLNSYNLINAKKEKNAFKIRKNMNKLYNALYPSEIEEEHEQVRNENDTYEKDENKVYSGNYEKHGPPSVDKISADNTSNNNLKKNDFKSRNVFNKEMKSNFIIDEDGLAVHNKNGYKDIDYGDINKQRTFDIFGSNEKVKSESNFAIVNYLKDFFQNSPYIKNFQNFIEVFFNKYDQRVLESTVFFNFDETLF